MKRQIKCYFPVTVVSSKSKLMFDRRLLLNDAFQMYEVRFRVPKTFEGFGTILLLKRTTKGISVKLYKMRLKYLRMISYCK